MILEGIVTTRDDAGRVNVAPMGPEVSTPPITRFTLKPFQESQTFRNLTTCRAGVLHVTDDVLLLAQASIGQPAPRTVPAETIVGARLVDCVRYYEFTVEAIDNSLPRAIVDCRVLLERDVRPFFGFNRAKHAVLELAILATRVHLIPRDEILAEVDRLRVLVAKTGGDDEQRAFDLLHQHILELALMGAPTP